VYRIPNTHDILSYCLACYLVVIVVVVLEQASGGCQGNVDGKLQGRKGEIPREGHQQGPVRQQDVSAGRFGDHYCQQSGGSCGRRRKGGVVVVATMVVGGRDSFVRGFVRAVCGAYKIEKKLGNSLYFLLTKHFL
jgi:hypothetical protein